MKYRAKITEIQTWVSEHFYDYENCIVKDAKDVYFEADNEDTAEKLEQLNKIKNQERSLKLTIIASCDDRFK